MTDEEKIGRLLEICESNQIDLKSVTALLHQSREDTIRDVTRLDTEQRAQGEKLNDQEEKIEKTDMRLGKLVIIFAAILGGTEMGKFFLEKIL